MAQKLLKIILSITLTSFIVQKTEAQEFVYTKKGKDIYHKNWIDFNKNHKKDIYEDFSQPIDKRVDNLLAQMTLNEKTCQMATLYGYKRVLQDALPNENWKKSIYKDGIGNIDEHLNGLAYHPQAITEYAWPPTKHIKAINEVQRFFVEDTRLGIPVDFTNEGIRGLCHHGATSFPAQIGIGSTWNKKLVFNIGEITGREAKILGYSNVYSPILDLARDPRWGRTVECYGESPFLVGELGLEMTKAIQLQGVASTAKHFAIYSTPKGGRDGEVRTDPHIAEKEMHQIYLEPFRKVVQQGGILGLMSSYNDYDGIPITGSAYFLTKLLREDWGFKGYVVSDSWAVGGLEGRHFVAENYKETVFQSVMAGLNIRTNFSPPEDFIIPLRELVNENRVPLKIINQRVKEILYVKFKLGLFDAPYTKSTSLTDREIHSTKNQETALQASRESIVLLKNKNNILPLDKKNIGSVLVTGPNAKAINHSISRYGPSNINVISIYEGIQKELKNHLKIEYALGSDFYDDNWPKNELYTIPLTAKQQKYIDQAVEKAKNAAIIVAVLGDNEHTVGESKSRTSLRLPKNQQALIQALYDTKKPIIAVLINGRPLAINWMDDHIDAIIEAWFPGEHGGTAIADVIFGNYNPGGKLPITFPRTVGQIPLNFPYKKSAQKAKDSLYATKTTRIKGPLYPFGYGLSYTKFEYNDLKITPDATTTKFDAITVSFTLKNGGYRIGDEIVQLYIRDRYSSVTTYEKQLRGFERITLKPNEKTKIEFKIHPEDLELLNKDMKRVVEPGSFDIMIGASSEDIRLKGIINITKD